MYGGTRAVNPIHYVNPVPLPPPLAAAIPYGGTCHCAGRTTTCPDCANLQKAINLSRARGVSEEEITPILAIAYTDAVAAAEASGDLPDAPDPPSTG